MPRPPRLVFVYNAKSGLLSAARDGLHKLLSPATYPCSLCTLTYGAVSMKRRWARYVAGLPYPVAFHYRDTASQRGWWGPEAPLPVALRVSGGAVEVLLSASDIDACEDLDALMSAVTEALSPGALTRRSAREPGETS